MRRSRGCELPGTFNPPIIGELFYLHATPWPKLTGSCIELLISALKKTVTLVLKHTVDDKSYDGLLFHVINPKFHELEHLLRLTADELLVPQQKGHPVTYNHYFTDCVQKARETHLRSDVRKKLRDFFPSQPFKTRQETHSFIMEELITALSIQTNTDKEIFASSEATDCMTAYYKV